MRHRDELYVKISDAPPVLHSPAPLGGAPGHTVRRSARGGVTMTPEALRSTWRGSYMFASAVNGLEERMKGPHYDVYDPWPVGPGL